MQSVKVEERAKGEIKEDTLDNSGLSQSIISSAFKNARSKFPKDFGLQPSGEKFHKNQKTASFAAKKVDGDILVRNNVPSIETKNSNENLEMNGVDYTLKPPGFKEFDTFENTEMPSFLSNESTKTTNPNFSICEFENDKLFTFFEDIEKLQEKFRQGIRRVKRSIYSLSESKPESESGHPMRVQPPETFKKDRKNQRFNDTYLTCYTCQDIIKCLHDIHRHNRHHEIFSSTRELRCGICHCLKTTSKPRPRKLVPRCCMNSCSCCNWRHGCCCYDLADSRKTIFKCNCEHWKYSRKCCQKSSSKRTKQRSSCDLHEGICKNVSDFHSKDSGVYNDWNESGSSESKIIPLVHKDSLCLLMEKCKNIRATPKRTKVIKFWDEEMQSNHTSSRRNAKLKNRHLNQTGSSSC